MSDRRKYVHLRHGVIIAREEQARIVQQPLADAQHLRLEVFEYVSDAIEATRNRTTHVVIADYERFGAAGIHGLAELMASCDAPVLLFVRDVSDWEREQFKALGVQRVFEARFKLSELATEVDRAIKRRFRIGSSDRLPVVSV
jgi:DNA-binding NtrC family response regulator